VHTAPESWFQLHRSPLTVVTCLFLCCCVSPCAQFEAIQMKSMSEIEKLEAELSRAKASEVRGGYEAAFFFSWHLHVRKLLECRPGPLPCATIRSKCVACYARALPSASFHLFVS
jgi:hypothetical protein